MFSADEIDIDDLKEEQQEVADIIGFDNYRQLMKYFAGTTIYIPKLSEIERIRRNEKIRTEYKSGNSMKVLAIKYDLTEVQIRNIVFDLYRSKKSAPVERQLSMDDYLNEDNQNKEENR